MKKNKILISVLESSLSALSVSLYSYSLNVAQVRRLQRIRKAIHSLLLELEAAEAEKND